MPERKPPLKTTENEKGAVHSWLVASSTADFARVKQLAVENNQVIIPVVENTTDGDLYSGFVRLKDEPVKYNCGSEEVTVGELVARAVLAEPSRLGFRIRPRALVSEARAIMASYGVTFVPVVDGNKYKGLIILDQLV